MMTEVTSIKFSILLLYRPIFPKAKIMLKFKAWFLVKFALVQFFSVMTQWTTVPALWSPAAYSDANRDNHRSDHIIWGGQ